MDLLGYLFSKKNKKADLNLPKAAHYSDSDIWNAVKGQYELMEDPVPAYPVDNCRDVMWISNDALFFAPKKMTSAEQIEKYTLSSIEKFFVDPRDHNLIRIKLVSPNRPQGDGKPLKFRGNALDNFRRLIPNKEYQFARKTMQLGKQSVANRSVKLGDLADVHSGGEFEEYLTTLFKALGYHAENTQMSGDQGIDVLVYKGGKKYGIQAKFYSQSVGNSAVQEVIAGREYFKLDKGVVVTNASFTTSAKQLAARTDIRLIDGELLEKIIRMAKRGEQQFSL